jgi:hypothetical protein
MAALVAVETVLLVALVVLVAGLLRSHAEILRALHDLGASVDPDAPGAPRPARATVTAPGGVERAADVAGVAADGATVALAVAGSGHDTVLAFLSTGCASCHPFWEGLQAPDAVPAGTRLVVVVQDEESESALRDLAGTLPVVRSSAAWNDYGVPGSPHVVHVDGRSGRVTGEGTGPDWPSVRAMLLQASADRATRGQRGGRGQDVEWRDNPTRIDAELLAAGIGPGHPSLAAAPEPSA